MARSRATGSPKRARRARPDNPDESFEQTLIEADTTVQLQRKDHGASPVPPGEGEPTVRSAGQVTRGASQQSVTVAVDEALSLSRGVRATLTLPLAGTAPAAPDAQSRYQDEGEIGRGGMGSVHRSFDRVLLRSVAMKLMQASGTSLETTARFVEEAQITGQLDHPNIVPVYEFGTLAGDQAYFTMKLVTGRTLSEVIRDLQGAELESESLERVLRILLKVCEAVAFAHSRGVVHRDLKPANIMIGSHGQVYVMDWGLGLLTAGRRAEAAAAAKQPGTTTVATSVPPGRRTGIEGTVPYMAPEQATGQLDAVDARTDVFALGAILYEVLTGEPPYRAPTLMEGLTLAAQARVTPPQERAGSRPLPPGLCEIAMRALRRDPAERYQRVEALHADLERFLRGGGWFATRRFAPGTVIVREGEPGDAAYVIAEGRCEVYREAQGSREPIRTLAAGDVFGETALLSAEPRSATVAALDEVTVKVVTADAFRREVERSSWLAALMRQLASRFLELERRQAGE